MAQSRTIKGIITSGDDNAGLPGVNVVLKGTSMASTNAEGAYSIPVPANAAKNATLVFSFIGTVTQEVLIGNQSSISVTLKTRRYFPG